MKELYLPSSKEVSVVDVPKMKFLMIDGEGDPNQGSLQGSFEALFPMAYGLKFMIKKKDAKKDFKVYPPEGLWWNKDDGSFDSGPGHKWKWTLMVAQPDFVTEKMVEEVRAQAMKKKDNPLLAKVRLEEFKEGKAAQIMHIGPYDKEGPNIEKVHKVILSLGKKPNGKHHEIYMSDMRKTPPEKWKTVIRQPFR
ncbi:MAG: GyrI-like domain-containing protein [Methanomassiliicoccales archaeon]|nr:GyrI-like domain-containing protein [Methanomassiliicoccales archaeon]